jgi:hypothetical protein
MTEHSGLQGAAKPLPLVVHVGSLDREATLTRRAIELRDQTGARADPIGADLEDRPLQKVNAAA